MVIITHMDLVNYYLYTCSLWHLVIRKLKIMTPSSS